MIDVLRLASGSTNSQATFCAIQLGVAVQSKRILEDQRGVAMVILVHDHEIALNGVHNPKGVSKIKQTQVCDCCPSRRESGTVALPGPLWIWRILTAMTSTERFLAIWDRLSTLLPTFGVGCLQHAHKLFKGLISHSSKRRRS